MITEKDISVKDIAPENGVDIFLSRPFSREQLDQSVQSLLLN